MQPSVAAIRRAATLGNSQTNPTTLKELHQRQRRNIVLHGPIAGKNPRPHDLFHKRTPSISSDKTLREELHRYIGGVLANHGSQPLIIGGVEDHVHILSTLSRIGTPAEMVKEAKRSSTLWLKTKKTDLQDFEWQNGYGMFSIGFSQIGVTRNYIGGQEEHHRKVSFQDEFREFLKRYAVDFDERYVWD